MKKELFYDNWDMQDFRELLEGMADRYAMNTAYLWHAANAVSAPVPAAEAPAAAEETVSSGDTPTEAGAAASATTAASAPVDDGIVTKTYTDLIEDVKNLATYLCALGLEGKHIAVTGKNSYLWMVSYLAIGCGCGLIVPIDRDLRADEIAGLMADAECAAVLYGEDMEPKFAEMETEPSLLRLPLAASDTYFARGAELRTEGSTIFESHEVDPDAPGVLLYTSGTMGVAKGVLLSQRNICADIVGVCRRVKITADDRVLSHLPLHHTYECTTSLAILYHGGSIAINENMRRLPKDLSLFRPTVFITVPAVLEFMSRFVRRSYADAKGGKLLLKLQSTASGIADKTVGLFSEGRAQKNKRKIFSTVDNFFGGRMRAFLVGAAALSPDIFNLFESFGYAIYCGYGLTETAPISLMHDDRYRCPDDTGFPVLGVEARIDDPDENGIGELCIQGPNVMLGYYKNPEATEEVLYDGWFHTGDLAQVTKSGAYRITGRKKSMIVAPNGKKIFPEELETYLMRSPVVGECMVYAEETNGTLQICAAVFPDQTETERLLGIPETDPQYDEKLRALLLELVRTTNNAFAPYKHIRRLIIRKSEFVKTTTKKIKRTDPANTAEEGTPEANGI